MILSRVVFTDQITQSFEPTPKQSGNGNLGASHTFGDYGRRAVVQVVQLDRYALILGE